MFQAWSVVASVGGLARLLYPRVEGHDAISFGFAVEIYFIGSCWIVAAQPAQWWLVIMDKNRVITNVKVAIRVLAAASSAIPLP
jgi:hypothetical protein